MQNKGKLEIGGNSSFLKNLCAILDILNTLQFKNK